MTYAEDSPEDRRLHRTYHDEIVNGVPARQLKSDKVIWRRGEDCIIVVNAASPRAQRIRAAKVGRVANQETHYDFGVYDEDEPPDEREIHLFVYRSGDRAVGLSILEKRTGICHYTWEEFDKHVQKTLEEQEAIWSLAFTWVHKKHRRCGIAKILLVEAARYLGVRVNEVGLYAPLSDDGEAFARSIFREGFLIAK
jgi:ribosomal protein S18 acetylase RimI-like enzyme